MNYSGLRKLFYAATLSFAVVFTSCNTEEDPMQFERADRIQEPVTAPVLVTPAENGQVIPGKFIVVLNDEVANQIGVSKDMSADRAGALVGNFANNLLAEYGETRPVEHAYGHALLGFAGEISDEVARKLANDSRVKYVEQDKIVALGRGGKKGGGSTTPPPQVTPWGITATNSGQTYTGSGRAFIVDTGIDLDHPDLNVASYGFSAFNKGKDSGYDDGNGHGTHCAGTVAAIDNSEGVVGVAAGALVVPVKVLGATGSGSNAGVIAGVDYVAANGVAGDVANMSLGGGASSALDQAVVAASSVVKFAVAAGNESQNTNNVSPGRVNGANIYTISAHDVNDNFASFSNYANPPVDFCAPGVSIASTWKSGGYNTISGTSMATPHVAGILLTGNVSSRGTVNGDPDGTPDQLATK